MQWIPDNLINKGHTPWIKLFTNAYDWVLKL